MNSESQTLYEREVRETKLAWHVFIQYLAHINYLNEWLDIYVKNGYEISIDMYNPRVSSKASTLHGRFEFLNYNSTCPAWTGPWEEQIRQINHNWKKIVVDLEREFKLIEDI